MNRYRICRLTCRSTAVRLMGASLSLVPSPEMYPRTHVAFRINLVSCPAFTTIPYTHSVFRSCAPRRSIWFGPTGIFVGADPG